MALLQYLRRPLPTRATSRNEMERMLAVRDQIIARQAVEIQQLRSELDQERGKQGVDLAPAWVRRPHTGTTCPR